MNKTLLTAELKTVSYRSPEVTVAEVHNEGVLCMSSPQATIQEWETGSINW